MKMITEAVQAAAFVTRKDVLDLFKVVKNTMQRLKSSSNEIANDHMQLKNDQR